MAIARRNGTARLLQSLAVVALIASIASATLGATLTVNNFYVDQSGAEQAVTIKCSDRIGYDSGTQVLGYGFTLEHDFDAGAQGNEPILCIFHMIPLNRCAHFFAYYNNPDQPGSNCGVPIGAYTDCAWQVNLAGFNLFYTEHVHTWRSC